MATRTFDPGEILATFLGIPLTAWGPDTFVAVERNEDAFTLTVGAGGETARSRNRNRSGLVTITLLASSVENDALSAAYLLDELRGEGVGPLFIKDRLGTTLVAAQNAWIKKLPNIEYAKEVGVREWVIECAKLDIFEGGSVLP